MQIWQLNKVKIESFSTLTLQVIGREGEMLNHWSDRDNGCADRIHLWLVDMLDGICDWLFAELQ